MKPIQVFWLLPTRVSRKHEITTMWHKKFVEHAISECCAHISSHFTIVRQIKRNEHSFLLASTISNRSNSKLNECVLTNCTTCAQNLYTPSFDVEMHSFGSVWIGFAVSMLGHLWSSFGDGTLTSTCAHQVIDHSGDACVWAMIACFENSHVFKCLFDTYAHTPTYTIVLISNSS